MLNDTHSERCAKIPCHHVGFPISAACQRGFTLIEVMVAMTITIILIVMVTNMFSDATTACNSGTDRAEMETDGRAALNFMSRKLSQAIAGPAEPSSYYRSFILSGGSNVIFNSVSDSIQSNRFYFDGSNLVYCFESYDPAILIGNVVDLKFYAFETYTMLNSGTGNPFECNLATNLPYCFDIAINLLSSNDKAKASQLSEPDLSKFKERNSRWFTTRAYFQTRQGYKIHDYEDADSEY